MDLKAFRVYGTFIAPDVARALRLPRGHLHADVFVAACSKPEALQMLHDHGMEISWHHVGFRLASGTDVNTMRSGGLFDNPRVFACAPPNYGPNRAIVALDGDQAGRRLGMLRFVDGRRFFEPEPAT